MIIKKTKRKNKKISLSALLGIARVSKSGYYKWLSKINEEDKDLEDYLIINEIFTQGKRKYGFRTMKMKIDKKGKAMNHKKIIRIMKKYGLRCKIRRRNPYREICKKTEEHRTFNNILDRKFSQTTPFTFLSTDISYMFYKGGLAFLSVVKDICTGEVVAWNLSRHIDMDLVMGTLRYMKENGNLISFENVVIHSDQGFHYTNPEYINEIKALGMVQSMSRKGNCIDNAPIESFFGHLKDEVDYKKCRTFGELKRKIVKYMDDYNNERCQWNLKKMAPVEYRNHLLLNP